MAEDPTPDWRLLAPHRPLSPGDDAYVARPTSGGAAISTWVAAGGSTVLVSGPAGVGKSTELAEAAQELGSARVALFAQLDRVANMHRVSCDELMNFIADHLVKLARERFGLPVSDRLASFKSGGATRTQLALAEIQRLAQQRVVLVLDGLEKLPRCSSTREIFDALAALPEFVDLVVVIPWHAAFGGGTDAILRPGEHLHRIAALDPAEGVAFLMQVFTRRLCLPAVPEAVLSLLSVAAWESGGIPRVFLQLMADAGTYARAQRGEAWPAAADLDQAIRDQEQSFRRALLPGDTKACFDVLNTDGRELDFERRVRLLAQGILLERSRDGELVLEAHPLVAKAINNSRR